MVLITETQPTTINRVYMTLSKYSEKVEKLAERVHWAYCASYEARHGTPYWTKGDYSLLDDETKEIDRVVVRAVIAGIKEDLGKPRILV